MAASGNGQERRDTSRRVRNSKGWRCDGVREVVLALETYKHAWGELHADDRAAIEIFTGIEPTASGKRLDLYIAGARKVEARLRREAQVDANETGHDKRLKGLVRKRA
jgi:hypothetical protein